MIHAYDFDERRAWSEGFLDDGLAAILRSRVPGCSEIRKASQADDRNGTDYWAERQAGLRPLSIDVKVRSQDYKLQGKDDLALETWSVLDEKPGWTRDQTKQTDYVLWFWQDTGRFFLVSFPALCRVFTLYWQEWRGVYEHHVQQSRSWQSECVMVPRAVVIAKLNAWQTGHLPSKTLENTSYDATRPRAGEL